MRVSSSPEETMKIAGKLAESLHPGDVIFLEGDLAAGKTVFVRGLVGALGGEKTDVDSPTFVILQSYVCQPPIRILHHLDLYRLRDDSLESIGLEEILAERDSVTAVEWPDERVLALMAAEQRLIRVKISANTESGRLLAIDVDGREFF